MRLPGCSTASAIRSPSSPKTALGEQAYLGLAPGEVGPGEHSGQDDRPKRRTVPDPIERDHGLFEAVDRPPIVAEELVGDAQGLSSPAPAG